MLKLKKLELLGFKSFCERTEMRFNGGGIAAVVGPNGCGKSNLSDAISWVLGEQSMKLLRGKKSEDVLWHGSEKRPRVGFAEVSLYLNNEDRQADIEYSEVVITRRLYRDGESEYLLNKNKVRLFSANPTPSLFRDFASIESAPRGTRFFSSAKNREKLRLS